MTPKLRFPEFTDEWHTKSFDQLFNFSTGKNIKQDEASPSFETPCVRYGELYHLYNEIIDKVVNYTNIPRSELTFSKGDEILLPSAGEDPMDIGSASALTIKDIAIGRTINVLRPKDDSSYNQIFVAYYINTLLKKRISKLAKGNSISNVYNSDLKKLTINLPTQVEQQKIADCLTTVDKKIETIDKKVELLKQYKKGVMQKIFSQQIRFKDEDGNDYPEWEEKSLSAIAERVTIRNKDASINLVLTNSATEGIVSQTEYFEKNIANKNNLSNYYIVSIDDFVYNPRISTHAPVGPIKRNHLSKGVMSPLYSIFRLKEGSKDFFEQYFETKYWHNYLKSVANSGARHDRMNITNNDFCSMPMPFPSLPEQQKIADFLSSIDAKIKAEETKLDSTKKFKRALLQRMFV